MATGLDHDNHRSLQRIATAMEGIVKELSRTVEAVEALAGRTELAPPDAHDDDVERRLLERLERAGLFRSHMTATDARAFLDG